MMNSFNFNVPFTKHKYVELETDLCKDSNVYGRFGLTTKGDHPGLSISLQLHVFSFYFTLYDDRHWDFDNDCFEKYESR